MFDRLVERAFDEVERRHVVLSGEIFPGGLPRACSGVSESGDSQSFMDARIF